MTMHLAYFESMLEPGVVQLLCEEISLVNGSGCFVNPHIAVVGLLAGWPLAFSGAHPHNQ